MFVSLRSNDTNDSFLSDLAVAFGAERIKLGDPVRGERNAKYNRLLRIERQLGDAALFANSSARLAAPAGLNSDIEGNRSTVVIGEVIYEN